MFVTVHCVVIFVVIWGSVYGDMPCAARRIPRQSAICVCNSTYCDTVTRVSPASDSYVAYTSSKDGLRFKKTTGTLITGESLSAKWHIVANAERPLAASATTLVSCARSAEGQVRVYTHHRNDDRNGEYSYEVTLQLDPSTQFQTIFGFGGAVTDAAGINWKNLSEPLKKHLINSYFSEHGLQYNMIRVPIGGSDFSTRPYAYNELPVDDVTLSNYSLSYEDLQYKIPFIKAGMELSKAPIHVLATTWSPPPWMKTNNAYGGNSRLKPQYYQTYADYIYKFIEKYTAEGIPVWGITTTNEPTNGVLGLGKFNSLGWTAETMGDWLINNLGPKIRNSTFKDTKILAVDDQRLFLYYWWNKMIKEKPKVLDYVDGVGLHYYTDFITPAEVQVEAMKSFPSKFLLNTESCEGSFPWERRVEPGSWQRAYNYVSDIITNLNHGSVGWLDWNLCLNAEGGPNWDKNFVDSPITVFPEHNEFHKQPMYYAMGHFSKFIPRGSKIIRRVQTKSMFTSFESVAVLTPESTVVVVMYNTGSARTVNVKLGNKVASMDCPGAAVITIELPYEP